MIDQESLWNECVARARGSYVSPITLYMNKMAEAIVEQRDNEVYAQIQEQIAVDVDKEELKKALAYDRNQYATGYSDGRMAGRDEGRLEMLTLLAEFLKENGYTVNNEEE